MAEEKRATSVVTWFNNGKGFGFITPSNGGDDLFVHHTAIASDGFRSLKQDLAVEFTVASGNEGREQAIDVVALEGSFSKVKGTTRSIDSLKTGGCYNCGEAGHFSRDCDKVKFSSEHDDREGRFVACYNCGESGHISKNCSENRKGGGVDRVKCYNCGDYGHILMDCIEDRGAVGGVKCYSCGELGHISKECGNPNSGNNGDRGCFTCGKAGHKAKDCTGKQSERVVTTKTHGYESERTVGGSGCYTCGQPGHMARDCNGVGSVAVEPKGRGGNSDGCFTCGQVRHVARECKNVNGSIRAINSNSRQAICDGKKPSQMDI